LTSYDAGQANQSISDEDVLKFAYERERAIITLNREDFISLHNSRFAHFFWSSRNCQKAENLDFVIV
jgi:hypothetical protein